MIIEHTCADDLRAVRKNQGSRRVAMLRLWKISGEELPNIDKEGLENVKGLKLRLRALHGFPVCLQQLLCDGRRLENSASLELVRDVQLVLLPVSGAPRLQVSDELLDALSYGHTEAARLLLKAGADQDMRIPGNGQTALMFASEEGRVDAVRLLLEAGADQDLCDVLEDSTALMFACEEGHVDVVQLLLEARAEMHLQNRSGRTALILASEGGHAEVVGLLLEAKASMSLQDGCSCTALMRACEKGHGKVASLLLDAGASTEFRNTSGRTALLLACEARFLSSTLSPFVLIFWGLLIKAE